MNFNWTQLFLKSLLLFNLSCGLYIGEKFETPTQKETLGCMNDLGQQIQDYIDHILPESEIEFLSECLQSSLLTFKYYVWGKNRTTYTPEELRSFIHDFFLQNQTISDNLMKELMIFKTSAVGGDVHLLTSKEIDQLIQLIAIFKDFLSLVYPHTKALAQKEFTSVEEMEGRLQELRQETQNFFKALFQKPYSLNSADNLIQQIKILLGLSHDTKAITALKIFKPFIFSQNTDIVQPDQWKPLISVMTDLLSANIYFLFPIEHNLKNRTAYLSQSFRHVLSFLEKVIGKTRSLSKKEIMNLARSMHDQNLISKDISLSGVQKILQIVFGKIMAQAEDDFSIGRDEYLWLKSEYEKWAKTQQALNDAHLQFKDSFSNQAHLFDEISPFTKFRPLYKENNDKDFNIYFVNNAHIDWDHLNYKNITITSFYSAIVRALFRGYAKKFPSQGLTQEEMVHLFRDVYSLYQDLGISVSSSSPDSENFGDMEFLSANILTYATKGYYTDSWVEDEGKKVELINEREAVEYLSIIQFVFRAVDQLFEKMKEFCSDPIEKSCFYKNILPAVEQSFSNMPHFLSEISEMASEEKEEYTHILFQLAVVNDHKRETVQYLHRDHMRNLVFSFLYQEVMFTRFDVNSDNILQETEVDQAFPLYQGIIQHVAKEIFCTDAQQMEEDKIDQSIYRFSVHYRHPPSSNDCDIWMLLKGRKCDKWKLAGRKWTNLWNLELTRLPLLQMAYHLTNSFLINIKKDRACE